MLSSDVTVYLIVLDEHCVCEGSVFSESELEKLRFICIKDFINQAVKQSNQSLCIGELIIVMQTKML